MPAQLRNIVQIHLELFIPVESRKCGRSNKKRKRAVGKYVNQRSRLQQVVFGGRVTVRMMSLHTRTSLDLIQNLCVSGHASNTDISVYLHFSHPDEEVCLCIDLSAHMDCLVSMRLSFTETAVKMFSYHYSVQMLPQDRMCTLLFFFFTKLQSPRVIFFT